MRSECTYSFPLIVDPQPHLSTLHDTQPCELACISSCNQSLQLNEHNISRIGMSSQEVAGKCETKCPPGEHVCGNTHFRAASNNLTATEPHEPSSCTAHTAAFRESILTRIKVSVPWASITRRTPNGDILPHAEDPVSADRDTGNRPADVQPLTDLP